MNYAIVIPARLNSTRLPNKPLIQINGIPMLLLTIRNCLKATNKNNIYVATESKTIKKMCNENKIQCVITSSKCLTGTDRVAEFAKKIKKDFYINVQGDEPLMPPNDIKKIINYAKKHPAKILNGYTKISDKKNFFSEHIPKLVFDKKNDLMYMSRSPIPFNKKKNFIFGHRQVCIYSFPRKMLLIFAKNKKKTIIENTEDIEILRFLEMGYKVKMLKLSNKSISVDTKKDKIKVENILKKKLK